MRAVRFVLVTLMLNVAFFGTYALCDELSDGLVAYYPFNGNANDESGNGNNGSVHGPTLAVDRSGKPNAAYSFDGQDDYILVPHSTSLNLTNVATISFWCNFRRVSAEPGTIYDWQCILMKTHDGDSYGVMLCNNCLANPDRTLRFYHMGLSDSRSQFTWAGLQANQWHHVAFTYDGNLVTAYIDGTKAAEFTRTGSIQPNGTELVIGIANWLSPNFPMDGSLDEIRIYNRALPESEIHALSREGMTPVPSATDLGLIILIAIMAVAGIYCLLARRREALCSV